MVADCGAEKNYGETHCHRCGEEKDPDRESGLCEDCDRLLERRARRQGVQCPNCRGRREVVNCIDDLCHARGECMHGGNDTCRLCNGSGRVDPETREEYVSKSQESDSS